MSTLGIIIIVAVVIILGYFAIRILMKNKTGRSVMLYFMSAIFIMIGVICGINLYKEVTAKSYINGDIDIENLETLESFKYSSSSLVFYDDIYDNKDLYTFTIDLTKVDSFDGEKNEYLIEINDYIIQTDNVRTSAGEISAIYYLDFHGVDGEVLCEASLDIDIKFISNKTTLSLVADSYAEASYLEQYFSDYGIRLKVLEVI